MNFETKKTILRTGGTDYLMVLQDGGRQSKRTVLVMSGMGAHLPQLRGCSGLAAGGALGTRRLYGGNEQCARVAGRRIQINVLVE